MSSRITLLNRSLIWYQMTFLYLLNCRSGLDDSSNTTHIHRPKITLINLCDATFLEILIVLSNNKKSELLRMSEATHIMFLVRRLTRPTVLRCDFSLHNCGFSDFALTPGAKTFHSLYLAITGRAESLVP